MSAVEKLRSLKSGPDLASLLGYSLRSLTYILYKLPDDDKYKEFAILKKNGGTRDIRAPKDKLRKLQYRLAEHLVAFYSEVYGSFHTRSISHGFIHGHSIVSNAIKHRNKRYVFNLDLESFFPSINFGRVRGYFISNRYLSLDPSVATLIAQIICYKNELPQGSPCSPIMSNLIGNILDMRILNLAASQKCTYTRYADDISISTNQKTFPCQIARISDCGKWIAGDTLRQTINDAGFLINTDKTSMQYRTSRQTVTGLIVNKRVNVPKEYYRKARSMCHELFNSGSYYLSSLMNEGTGETEYELGSLNQLHGVLEYIYSIKRRYIVGSIEVRERLNCPKGITKLYREFLFYRLFVVEDAPILLTEGKTDITYIRTALKSLAADYPDLITKNQYGHDFHVRFVSKSKRFLEIFAIAKGTSGLNSFVSKYEQMMRRYTHRQHSRAVILILDNDRGIQSLNSQLNSAEQITTKVYYHSNNLYSMVIPYDDNKSIENLFDDSVLATKLNGKSFSNSNKFDTSKEYGKSVFAEHVILPNQATINFTEFKLLFNNIRTITWHHKARQARE